VVGEACGGCRIEKEVFKGAWCSVGAIVRALGSRLMMGGLLGQGWVRRGGVLWGW